MRIVSVADANITVSALHVGFQKTLAARTNRLANKITFSKQTRGRIIKHKRCSNGIYALQYTHSSYDGYIRCRLFTSNIVNYREFLTNSLFLHKIKPSDLVSCHEKGSVILSPLCTKRFCCATVVGAVMKHLKTHEEMFSYKVDGFHLRSFSVYQYPWQYVSF